MPTVLDIFNDDAFGVVEMTKGINLLPFQPSRLGQLGLFQTKGVRTTSVAIERQGNKLMLLPSVARGTGGAKRQQGLRDIRSLRVPHIPQNDIVLADDVQDVRAFDQENTMQTIAGVVSDRQTSMLQNHEVTEEWLRIGAIQGVVVDGDGTTTLYNLFDEFNLTETGTIFFDLGTATTEVKLKCMQVQRTMEDELGGTTYSSIRGFCGNSFWDKLITHPLVKEAYDRWQDGRFLREDQRLPGGTGGFEYAGIYFENYRGGIAGGSNEADPFIPTDVCRFVAQGVQALFQTFYAPADYVEAVNTVGRRVYSKQQRLEFDRGIELETQSNPLPICTRPNTLLKGDEAAS